MNNKILLLVPAYLEFVYKNSKIKVGVPNSPNLSLAALSGQLLKHGVEVKILDLNLYREPFKQLENVITSFNPGYVGITFTTLLFNEANKIARFVKQKWPEIKVLYGGSHSSSMPEITLKESVADIVIIGEGENTVIDIITGKPLYNIPGIAYKDNGQICITQKREFIKDLDTLPFPAWHLFELNKYTMKNVQAKKYPTGWIETSRGCPFNCCFCNKSVFGRQFRIKSVIRVVEEIEYMLKVGFKEIHISDDTFNTDVNRVKKICQEIIKRDLHFPWATVTGIRVDCVDQEMFDLMKQAGCYRVSFGIESGNQQILDRIGKKITLSQIEHAIRLAVNSGLEIVGFFMLALPGETEQTMQDTIDFACKLDLDFAKVAITTPLPSTPLFDELDKNGLIKTKEWSNYNLYLPNTRIYNHQNLSWDVIAKYFNLFYRKFYLRPKYIIKRFKKAITQRTLLDNFIYFLKTRW